jgi:hypothetical protein
MQIVLKMLQFSNDGFRSPGFDFGNSSIYQLLGRRSIPEVVFEIVERAYDVSHAKTHEKSTHSKGYSQPST